MEVTKAYLFRFSIQFLDFYSKNVKIKSTKQESKYPYPA